MENKSVRCLPGRLPGYMVWMGPENALSFDASDIGDCLRDLKRASFWVRRGDAIGVAVTGRFVSRDDALSGGDEGICHLPALSPADLGDERFSAWHGCRYPLYAGSMAHGISSEAMVLALGKQGFLSSFGAGGVTPPVLEETILRLKQALPHGPLAFNLIHNPFAEAMESAAMELYLRHGVSTVEASAYMALTPHIVRYRVAGLKTDEQGGIAITHKVIAKVSRREVAAKFMAPAPEKTVAELVAQGMLSREQAALSGRVPMADDITVEADSGGHTDNRPLVSLLPSMIALRDEMQERYRFVQPVRVGAAGGIGTPAAAAAAFAMGAAYVVTGSINQACIEAGTSAAVKELLSQVAMADVIMAPAFDMFEMGGKLQVVKRGTMFAMRAKKLSDLYQSCRSLDEIPAAERDKLEQQVFRRSFDDVWQETVGYFNQRDPDQIRRAEANPRKKMALVFRWYLGLASHWANSGEKDRKMDYQIWCGPAMGAFNDWTRGTYLASPEQRRVVDANYHLLAGAAYLQRLQTLRMHGLRFSPAFEQYRPLPGDPAASGLEAG